MSVKDNRGATLVELIVSIAIFGVIAAAALGLLLFATNINSDVTADTIEMSRVYQSLDVVKSSAAASEKLKVGYVENTEVTIDTATGSFKWTAQGGSLVYSTGGGSVVLVEGIEPSSSARTTTPTRATPWNCWMPRSAMWWAPVSTPATPPSAFPLW